MHDTGPIDHLSRGRYASRAVEQRCDKCVCKYLLPTERERGKVYFGIYSSRRFLCGEYESSFLSFSLVPRIFLAAWLLRAGTGLNRFKYIKNQPNL